MWPSVPFLRYPETHVAVRCNAQQKAQSFGQMAPPPTGPTSWTGSSPQQRPQAASEVIRLISRCTHRLRHLGSPCERRGTDGWSPGGLKNLCHLTCLQVCPQSDVMYISSLYSTNCEPRLPDQ